MARLLHYNLGTITAEMGKLSKAWTGVEYWRRRRSNTLVL